MDSPPDNRRRLYSSPNDELDDNPFDSPGAPRNVRQRIARPIRNLSVARDMFAPRRIHQFVPEVINTENGASFEVVNPIDNDPPMDLGGVVQQLIVVPPVNFEITTSNYPGFCQICQMNSIDSDDNDFCYVNCNARHIFHCSCINQWRNTRLSNPYMVYGYQPNCPICRDRITEIGKITITPETETKLANTKFGKNKFKFKFGNAKKKKEKRSFLEQIKYISPQGLVTKAGSTDKEIFKARKKYMYDETDKYRKKYHDSNENKAEKLGIDFNKMNLNLIEQPKQKIKISENEDIFSRLSLDFGKNNKLRQLFADIKYLKKRKN